VSGAFFVLGARDIYSMLPDLLPYLHCLDWTDETILKAVKDLEAGNLTAEQFDQVVTGHERLYKLKALAEKEEND
jgi:hypothetical protein